MERTHLHTPEGGQDVAVEGLRVGDVRSGFDVGLDLGEPARGVRGEGDLAIDYLRSRLTALADLLGEEILGNLSRQSGHAAAYASAVPVVHTPNIALGTLAPADRRHQRRLSDVSVPGRVCGGLPAGVYLRGYTCGHARPRSRDGTHSSMS
jgi:hypothetical protein